MNLEELNQQTTTMTIISPTSSIYILISSIYDQESVYFLPFTIFHH